MLGTLVGMFWMFQNFVFVPQYGDTNEYLARSKTMMVDQYRGVLYPAVLNYASVLSSALRLPQQVIIYAVQVLVALFAIYSLANFLLRNFPSGKIISALTSITVIFNPLIAHFALTLMADSLATSFTLIFIVFLTKGCFSDVSSAKRSLYLAFASLAFILMATTRTEKIYLASLLFLGCCVVIMTVKRRLHIPHRAAASGLLATIFFTAAIGMSIFIKKETTVYNTNRPPLDFYSLAFNRVVWPRMSDAYNFFPDALKQEVTLDEAKKFDSDANFVYPFLVKTLSKNGGVEQINSITLLTLEHFPIHIAGKIFFDFFSYTTPNFTFPMEAMNILPESRSTSWTISRMEMFTPMLSRAFLFIGYMQFFALLVFLLVKCPRIPKIGSVTLLNPFNLFRLNSPPLGASDLTKLEFDTSRFAVRFFIRKLIFESPFIFLVLGATIFLNSGMFTLFAGMGAHIRYALPTYTIIQTVVVSFAISRIFFILKKAN